MKHIFTLFSFCLALSLNAQFDGKKIQNSTPVQNTNGLNLKWDKIPKPKTSNKSTATPLNINSLQYNLDKQSAFKVSKLNDNGSVQWMTGYTPPQKDLNIEDKAQLWLDYAQKEMNLNSNRNEFKPFQTWTDKLGEEHIKLAQYHQGLKVYGAEIILHHKNDRIYLQNGIYALDKELPKYKSDVIDESLAQETVKNKLSNFDDNWKKQNGIALPIDKAQWEKELVYYSHKGSYKICYFISVYPNLGEHYNYFIDASTGEVIDSYSTVCHFHHGLGSDSKVASAHNHKNCNHKHHRSNNAESFSALPPDGPVVANATDLLNETREINTYEFNNNFYMIDASREMFNATSSELPDNPIGAIWTIDLNNDSPTDPNALFTHVASTNNNWTASPEGVSAHYNGGEAYEYYKNVHGREAITGDGQTILSFINVADEDGSGLDNAFWNGIGIYYGNGNTQFRSLGRGLDVAGHEMTHGMIEATANLEYRNESGAMNESFADIFGAMIDRDDWNIGEDVVLLSAFPSGTMRSMEDPHNGAATGDFGRGWQPKHVDEMYLGEEDNGGVHINSGIPNHAYYLFATQVGKDVAEQTFYRAITTYLTRSSGFNELRFAVLQSANDLYGPNVEEAAALAFDQVGITDGSSGVEQMDFEVNPGQDFLLVSDQALSNLFMFNLQTGDLLFNPLSETDVLSKPSISDDGSVITFVGTDNHIHIITLDWSTDPPTPEEFIVSETPDWRNAVISKDGRFLALLQNQAVNNVILADITNGTGNEFVLQNPTTAQGGLSTSEIQYADAIEFDATSTVLMFDALNRIQNANTETVEFWDIGFLEVWNPQQDTWALGNVFKLFSNLPSGLSIGNPSFSKNSPNIIALDLFDGTNFEILGLNVETGDLASILPNTGLGYPSYSRNDELLIYDLAVLGYSDLGILQLNPDKITSISNSDDILIQGAKWGVWFSNGERILSDVEDVVVNAGSLTINPNPSVDFINVSLNNDAFKGSALIEIYNLSGQKVMSLNRDVSQLLNHQIAIEDLDAGSYLLSIRTNDKIVTERFIKK